MDPSRTPALAPPPGVISNFDDPVNREHEIRAVVIFTIAFAGVFVALRVYTTAWITRRFWWDDFLAVSALLFGTAWSIIIIKASHQALGKHLWDIPVTVALETEKTQVALYAVYLPYMFCIKASVLVLYLHIFGSASAKFRRAVFTILILTGAYAMAALLASIFNCTPREKRWNPQLPGRCIHFLSLCLTSCIVNVILDVVIYILPMKLVWNLHVPTKQKIMLSFLLASGAFVCIASAFRLRYTILEYRSTDVSWVSADGVIWAVIEASFGLACGCLPFMKPLLQHHFPSIAGPRTVTGYSKGYSSASSQWSDRKPSAASFHVSEIKNVYVKPPGSITISRPILVHNEPV